MKKKTVKRSVPTTRSVLLSLASATSAIAGALKRLALAETVKHRGRSARRVLAPEKASRAQGGRS